MPNPTHCPSCKAPVGESDICEYCGTRLWMPAEPASPPPFPPPGQPPQTYPAPPQPGRLRPPPNHRGRGFATASLVLGIIFCAGSLGILQDGTEMPWGSVIMYTLPVVFAILSRKRGDYKRATAWLVLGAMGVVFGIIGLFV